MNVYVSNLSFNVQDEDLREFSLLMEKLPQQKSLMTGNPANPADLDLLRCPMTKPLKKQLQN